MSKVITIAGGARHGKNTLADMLKEEIEQYGYKVGIVAYADYVKLLAKTLYGWDGNKDEKGRTLLQNFGTDIVRSIDPDFWVKIVEQSIHVLRKEFQYFIVSDARFPNEIEYLKNKNHWVLSLYIERPGFNSNLTEEQLHHASETGLSAKDCDILVVNDSLEFLKKQACILVNELII